MTASDLVSSTIPEPAAQVADVPCRKCQYNLRSLPPDGRCPECGTPIAFSIQGDLIRFSDPNWVQGLRCGAVVSVIAMLVSLVGSALVSFVFRRSQMAQIFSNFISELFFLIGAWLLTMPDPGGVGEDK